jgi:hypothetical protein
VIRFPLDCVKQSGSLYGIHGNQRDPVCLGFLIENRVPIWNPGKPVGGIGI